MEDYKPNSHRFKEEQSTKPEERKKLEKVVTGKVRTKKKSETSKLAEIFIAEDAANVKNYILMDVLVPAIKKAISDIVRDGIDMILYGEASGKRKPGTNSMYVSYNKCSYPREYDRREPQRTRGGYNPDDIVLETRGEAEEVLARMDELIDMYGQVSVADLYDLVGKTCEYTDNKYGWTNIRNAEPVRVRDGYLLKMPKALPI